MNHQCYYLAMNHIDSTPRIKLVRVTFTMPEEVVNQLDDELTEGNKSRFATEAMQKEIAYKKRIRALKGLAELPPAFPHIKDAAEYIREMRQQEGKDRNAHLGL